jgi:hypothetical protein
LREIWVVWEVFSLPPELSPPPEWIGWGGRYGYARGGGYEYGWGAGPTNEPPARGGGYEYGGEGKDMVKEHCHPMNHRPEVEGMDREDSGMGEDMMDKVEVVEKESEGMVLVRHWTDDGAARHRCAHREWEELAKLGYSECQLMSISRDSNCCSPWRRV